MEVARTTRPPGLHAFVAGRSEETQLFSRAHARTTDFEEPGIDGSSKFIFDLMELERPKVDRAVLDFVKGHVFDPADFVIRSEGVCRLNPELARMVVAKV